MDQKLYIEKPGKPRQELEPQVELQTELSELFGVKELSAGGIKVLGREELNGRHYEYVLTEPTGGKILRGLIAAGERFDLVVAIGEWRGAGRRRVFKPVEVYTISNLLPHGRIFSHDKSIRLICSTLDMPVLQEGAENNA